MDIIKEPFRILKNIIRWFSKDNNSDNLLECVRKGDITPDLWQKAVDKFEKEAKVIPIYENHNHEKVVGEVISLEAKSDGLYVKEHRLMPEGLELVKSGKYTLPSIDAVITKDNTGNIIDLELFGISLVNSAGATDVELVTMDKDETIALSKIEIKEKEKQIMDLMELWETLSDDDVINEIPEELLKKIVESKKDEISKLMGATEETEQTKEEGEEEENDDDEKKDKKEEVEQEKENDEEDEEDEDEDKEGTKSEACMSKFYDAVARAESRNNGHAIPSTLKSAEKIIKKLVGTVSSNKAVNIAIKEVGFYGMNKSETVAMGKRSSSVGDIVKDILKVD